MQGDETVDKELLRQALSLTTATCSRAARSTATASASSTTTRIAASSTPRWIRRRTSSPGQDRRRLVRDPEGLARLPARDRHHGQQDHGRSRRPPRAEDRRGRAVLGRRGRRVEGAPAAPRLLRRGRHRAQQHRLRRPDGPRREGGREADRLALVRRGLLLARRLHRVGLGLAATCSGAATTARSSRTSAGATTATSSRSRDRTSSTRSGASARRSRRACSTSTTTPRSSTAARSCSSHSQREGTTRGFVRYGLTDRQIEESLQINAASMIWREVAAGSKVGSCDSQTVPGLPCRV